LYSLRIASKESRANGRRLNVLYGDDEQLARSSDLAIVYDRFESDLRIFVAELARHRVFVHAGVVGWKGQGIVIPGRSYSGKSTLVAELVRAGATYYSDEYAVLDTRGRVHPFIKPLELREEGEFSQTKISAAELGGQSGTKPLPVGSGFDDDSLRAARAGVRESSLPAGEVEMLFNTVSARRSPEKRWRRLQCVASQADVLKGVRGDATKVCRIIAQKSGEH